MLKLVCYTLSGMKTPTKIKGLQVVYVYKHIKVDKQGRNLGLTIFADEEVQVAVGVGHAHLGLHLWSLQGGVNLPRTALLRRRLHLTQPAAHGSTVCLSVCARTLSTRQSRLRQCFIVTRVSLCVSTEEMSECVCVCGFEYRR